MKDGLQDPRRKAPPAADQWYYANGRRRIGPVSVAVLRALAARSRVRRDTLVWREGLADWVPARQIDGLLPAGAPLAAREYAALSRGQVLQQCPFCAEHIDARASKCPLCAEVLPPADAPAGAAPPATTGPPPVCPSCRTLSPRGAAHCQQCGQALPRVPWTPALGDALGAALVAVPRVGLALMIALLLVPDPALLIALNGLVVLLVVLTTTVLATVDAVRLGMGGGATGWCIGHLLLWVVAHPWYLRHRVQYGGRPRFLGGLIIAVLLAAGVFWVPALGAVIEDWRHADRPATHAPQAEAASGATYQVLESDTRVVRGDEYFVHVAWSLRLRNKTVEDRLYVAHIRFLDKNGVVLHEDTEYGLVLGPRDVKLFEYETMMNTAAWASTATFKIDIRPL